MGETRNIKSFFIWPILGRLWGGSVDSFDPLLPNPLLIGSGNYDKLTRKHYSRMRTARVSNYVFWWWPPLVLTLPAYWLPWVLTPWLTHPITPLVKTLSSPNNICFRCGGNVVTNLVHRLAFCTESHDPYLVHVTLFPFISENYEVSYPRSCNLVTRCRHEQITLHLGSTRPHFSVKNFLGMIWVGDGVIEGSLTWFKISVIAPNTAFCTKKEMVAAVVVCEVGPVRIQF